MPTNRKVAALKQQRSIETRNALLEGAARTFAQLPYSQARQSDIARESGVSEGALYFHFGTKADMARAVLAAQQEKMAAELDLTRSASATALDSVVSLMRQLARLVAKDAVVQGGIQLAAHPSEDFMTAVKAPYFEWERTARSIIEEGVIDGSIRRDIDVDGASQLVNAAFVGAQVLSGMEDSWKSLPKRVELVIPLIVTALAPAL